MARRLTPQELESAVIGLPPILTPQEAADVLRIKLSTLYRWTSENRFPTAAKRRKPLRFLRDRLMQEFLSS